MRRWFALAATLLLATWAQAASAAEVETLRETGPIERRFNIAVLGDGYRDVDQAKLTTDARAITDYLFGVAPLRQYAQFFNVKLVHVVSNENGADNGTYGDLRDTALDAYFNCDGIDRLLCIDDGKAAVAAAADVPEYNFAIVLVNDPKYGGSGGSICASSSNEDSFEVLAHEIGHSLAHLADEYSYEGNQPPCNDKTDCREANATVHNQLDQIKWKNWIEDGTPIPTPATSRYSDVVGLFEGARYTPLGVYRPQLNCKMRDLGAEYCSVCAEQFVKSIWSADNIQMIETAEPAATTLSVATCDAVELSVTTPPITPATYRFSWSVDGNAQAESTSAIKLSPGALGPGEHQVLLVVEDATDLVRTDPLDLLQDGYAWALNITKADCPQPAGGVGGSGGSAAAGGGVGATASGGSAGETAGSASAGESPAGSSGGALSTAGTAPGSAGASLRPPPPPRTSGCSCKLAGERTGRAAPAASLAALLIGLARLRRRPRRSHRRRKPPAT